MVRDQLLKRGIRDEDVLNAVRKVPRHQFIPSELQKLAYQDQAISIGAGQTISQPYMVGYMTEALQLRPENQVLEIGTGSGYQTAVLAELCQDVYTIERIPELAQSARERLQQLGYSNIHFKIADGTLGWPEGHSVFDAILVAAGAPSAVEPLVRQLKEGGRMVFPVGDRREQTLVRLTKQRGDLTTEELCKCVFVPLVGEFGWNN